MVNEGPDIRDQEHDSSERDPGERVSGERVSGEQRAAGYDEGFLGVAVPFPAPTGARETRALDYVHFSVLLDPARRLAVATGVNIDGAGMVEVDRGDDWHLDDRIPEEEQTGPAVYARNDLDRGHLVRRRDPVWGDPAEAAAANVDTFCYTNAAPQAADFNQGKELWVGLEDHVLAYADVNDVRLSVFTGPVLDPSDPPYRGTQIPRRFWKVATWTVGSPTVGDRQLRSAAFVLDQTPNLDDLENRGDLEPGDESRGALPDAPPPLGPFRTFQVPVSDVARATGLDLDLLSAADVLSPVPAAVPARSEWRELRAWTEITLARE
jgi:endonuclease G